MLKNGDHHLELRQTTKGGKIGLRAGSLEFLFVKVSGLTEVITFVKYVPTSVLLAPLDLYPFIGIAISSFLKAFGTARYLHEPYFKAKKMDNHQIALFMEERKWDYRGLELC